MTRHIAWLFAGLILLSCTSAVRQRTRQEEPRTTVRVTNHGFADMRIYVVHKSQRIRLGTAPGGRSTAFVIPPDAVAGTTSLRFIAIPIGGGQPLIDEFPMRPGEEVTMFIPPG